VTPRHSRIPDDKGQLSGPPADTSMSWGTRQSESETVSRAGAHPHDDEGPLQCPSCGSEKTTVVRAANRSPGNSIRRDNPGHRCFACGTGWTVTISGDHDPDAS
jgi:hypothetical protein